MLELRRTGDACAHVTRELREVFSRAPRRARQAPARRPADADRPRRRADRQAAPGVLAGGGRRCAPPSAARAADLDPLDSQAVIWFQLVSGDKEPEAYIDHEDRAGVRGTMVVAHRCARMRATGASWSRLAVGLAALAALVALLPILAETPERSQILACRRTGRHRAGRLAGVGRAHGAKEPRRARRAAVEHRARRGHQPQDAARRRAAARRRRRGRAAGCRRAGTPRRGDALRWPSRGVAATRFGPPRAAGRQSRGARRRP